MEQSVIAVAGMTCDHCARAVSAELRQIPGVREVDVDVAAGSVRIEADPVPDVATLRAAVEEAGYELAG